MNYIWIMRTLLLGGGTLLKETTLLGVGVQAPKSLYTSFGVGPLTPSSLYTSLGVGGGERVTNFGVSFLMELAI